LEIISLIIGFFLGIIVVGIAFEIGMKKLTGSTPASKHTKTWDISEISNPRIMAEYLSDVELPKNSKVLVNKYKSKEVLTGLQAKEHRGIRGNFILGDDRALILAGPIKKHEIGFWTVEEDIVKQLNQQFNQMWTEASNIHQNKEN